MILSAVRHAVAFGFRYSQWGGVVLFANLTVCFWQSYVELAASGSSSIESLAAMLAAVPVGSLVCRLILYFVFQAIGSGICGSPFHVGDRVRILVGPHRGCISCIYALWPERMQVRVGARGAGEERRHGCVLLAGSLPDEGCGKSHQLRRFCGRSAR